jgi:hypothetical protein
VSVHWQLRKLFPWCRSRWLAVAILYPLSLSSCASPPSDLQAQVTDPNAPTPGDWWEFRINPANPLACARWEYQGAREGLHVARCGSMLMHTDRDGNYVKTSDLSGNVVLQEYDPCWRGLSHPLFMGKTWQARSHGRRPGRASLRWRSSLTARVVAEEEVRVPAGTFHAFRIAVTDIWSVAGSDTMDTSSPPTGIYTTTLWYTPAVGTFVKQVSSDGLWDSELVAYQYRPRSSSR